jgi:hypothetical protein
MRVTANKLCQTLFDSCFYPVGIVLHVVTGAFDDIQDRELCNCAPAPKRRHIQPQDETGGSDRKEQECGVSG